MWGVCGTLGAALPAGVDLEDAKTKTEMSAAARDKQNGKKPAGKAPLSLAPLTPEEGIKRVLAAHPKNTPREHGAAWEAQESKEVRESRSLERRHGAKVGFRSPAGESAIGTGA